MGLDNMVHELPDSGCKQPDGTVDCKAAVANGHCVWHQQLGNEPGLVLGILGTYCWLRGGHVNDICHELGIGSDSFYGEETAATEDDDPTPNITPAGCRELADRIDTALTARGAPVFLHGEDVTDTARYAVKWLRFAADHGGVDAWW